MTERLLAHREEEKRTMIERGETGYESRPLKVWTSTRRRTVETAKYLHDYGYKIRQRSQLSQLHPGVCEKMSERRIRAEYGDEVAKHELDPYHHRYPRAEVSRISDLEGICALLTILTSRIMIWLYALSQSSLNWRENRLICSSSHTKVF
jgi:broad specificity phosphatase PhoE